MGDSTQDICKKNFNKTKNISKKGNEKKNMGCT